MTTKKRINHFVFLNPGERLFVVTGAGDIAGEDWAYVLEVNMPAEEHDGRMYLTNVKPTVIVHETYCLNQECNLAEYGGCVLEGYRKVNEAALAKPKENEDAV